MAAARPPSDRPSSYDAVIHHQLASNKRWPRWTTAHMYVHSDFIADHYAPISLDDARRLYPCSLFVHPNRTSIAAYHEHYKRYPSAKVASSQRGIESRAQVGFV